MITDTDIAKDAIYLLECDIHFLGGKVMVTVEDGLLTLEGTVEWDFQKAAAEKAMQCIRGVEAVANLIEVSPAASPADIQKRIEKVAARDQAAVPGGRVHHGGMRLLSPEQTRGLAANCPNRRRFDCRVSLRRAETQVCPYVVKLNEL